ncbi:serum paraoxonase/arylesterase 1 [Hydra vulgaris]|uniref:serum paraoxonase/arylesterase 1 n=1 Tax=Hydra vulgaris TaxID=6087 RepID=UPI001F5E4D4D|nr:serum paraoxonase/arylesterase 1-like [Hydra vulgaris]
MINFKIIVVTVLSAILIPKIYLWLTSNAVGVQFYNVYPGMCKSIPGIVCGSEKITVTSDGLAFFTSGMKGASNCDHRYLHGRIYLFDFKDPEKGATELFLKSNSIIPSNFSPHGMDLFEDLKNNLIKLLVINHANHRESVEVFVFRRSEPSHLDHVKTLTDKKFVCLNDIAVINENIFYVTNYLKYCQYNEFASLLFEVGLKMPTSNIVYYNEGSTLVAADGYSSLNGIAINKDFSVVFVSSAANKTLSVFKREADSGKLLLHNAIDVSYSPDNVYIDHQTGILYVAVFKKPLHFFLAIRNLTLNTGTGIKIVPDSNQWKKADVTEVFHDNGQLIQSASMIVFYKNQYLIGSVYNTLVYCRTDNI